MASPYLGNIDLGYNQLLRGRLDNQGADPGSLGTTHQGYGIFRTDIHVGKIWNGTAFDVLTGGIVTVSGTAASSTIGGVSAATAAAAAGRQDQAITLTLNAATGSLAGTMSAADFAKLAAATNLNTVSTIVMRDGSGNFTAGTITAALTGTASNATNLNNQADTFYLSRTNHTGTQLAATISNFDTQVRTSRLDQMASPTAAVAFNAQKITGLADPSSAQDAATKNYVDNVASGLDVKASVRIGSTGNVVIATNGLAAIDGVTPVAGDRVLLKSQTAPAENGIYVAAVGAWTRATDFDTTAEASPGAFTFVEEGTTNADTGWVLTTNAPITLGTTGLTWAQFSGAGSYLAGNGLSLTGTTFAVVGTTNRISVSGSGVDISASYVGQTTITTLGTITTGTWTGTAIAVLNGGTGATTPAAARTNLGATTKVVGTITGNGVLTSFSFAHSIGTINHSLTMFDGSGNITYTDFTLGTNTDTIVTAQAIPNAVAYTVVAIG